MTIRAGFFGKTVTEAVTDAAASYTVPGTVDSKHAFLISSDVAVHVTRVSSGETAVPASASVGLRIPASTLVLINTFAGDVISFIVAAGETTGTLWITEVDH